MTSWNEEDQNDLLFTSSMKLLHMNGGNGKKTGGEMHESHLKKMFEEENSMVMTMMLEIVLVHRGIDSIGHVFFDWDETSLPPTLNVVWSCTSTTTTTTRFIDQIENDTARYRILSNPLINVLFGKIISFDVILHEFFMRNRSERRAKRIEGEKLRGEKTRFTWCHWSIDLISEGIVRNPIASELDLECYISSHWHI